MQRSVKIALAAVAVVIVVGAAGFWYFVLRDTSDPVASLEALEGDQSSSQTISDPTTDPNGTWTVVVGENVFAGYRIQELFGGETIKKTATGRTPVVTGTMTVQGNQITVVDLTADLSQLKSSETRRDNSQRNSGLQIDTFPTATFTLTEPISLPSAPAEGSAADVQAVGELTLHGVTRPVTIPLQTSLRDGRINVAGGAPIVLADFEIQPPDSGFVSVDDNGTFEVQLAFVKS